MIRCKIFTEGNEGPQELEDKINKFLKMLTLPAIISTNTVVEKVDGIYYLTVVILYE